MHTLESVEEFERFVKAPGDFLLVLFKHSSTCGISLEAYDELRTFVGEATSVVKIAVVTVQTHRAVSDAISICFNVRHETPQVLLIKKGAVVWDASHFNITAETVKKAVGLHLS